MVSSRAHINSGMQGRQIKYQNHKHSPLDLDFQSKEWSNKTDLMEVILRNEICLRKSQITDRCTHEENM